jgi:pimeloyl-ACP methyl ester carboxylesterase
MPISIIKILIIIGIIIGFILIYSLLQFLISIHPPRFYDLNTPSNYGLKYENISVLTSDKIKIKGWLIKSDKANGTVIVGHGYPFDKGNILPVAKFLYPDYNIIFYDHRYFGESSGKISTVGYKEVEDVKAVVNFAKNKFPGKPIALYGFSLSGSAMLMAKTNVNAIIADSPYAELNKMIEHTYFYFGSLKFPFVITTKFYAKIFLNIDPKKVSPVKAVKNLNTPIFVIHGEKDSQIPVENAYALKESNPNIELWIVENTDHGYSYAINPKEYEKRVKSFLKKHM